MQFDATSSKDRRVGRRTLPGQISFCRGLPVACATGQSRASLPERWRFLANKELDGLKQSSSQTGTIDPGSCLTLFCSRLLERLVSPRYDAVVT